MFELLELCGKAVEYTIDAAVTDVKDITEFERNLASLQKNLKSLSAKAADVDEEIKNAELYRGKKRKREVEEWLEEVEFIKTQVDEVASEVELEGFTVRLTEGRRVAKLNEQVEKLVAQSRDFGQLVHDVPGESGEAFLIDGLVGKAFNENMETIWKNLESRQVSCIGVYGMGGAGKSTLAMHIHNRLLQQSQGRVFWVVVSQEFTVAGLQDKIARFLGVKLRGEKNEDIRAARLHRALSEMKNTVLILDDVWENIDLLKVGCRPSVECCRLIITTRSLKVCRQIGCQKEILVDKLGEDEAWELFIEKLGNEQLDPQVEEIAKSMAKMCDGLPLRIITVAGSMKGETTMHTWRNALENLKEYLGGKDDTREDDDKVFKALTISFSIACIFFIALFRFPH